MTARLYGMYWRELPRYKDDWLELRGGGDRRLYAYGAPLVRLSYAQYHLICLFLCRTPLPVSYNDMSRLLYNQPYIADKAFDPSSPLRRLLSGLRRRLPPYLSLTTCYKNHYLMIVDQPSKESLWASYPSLLPPLSISI